MNGCLIRPAIAADMPRIRELHQELEQTTCMKLDLPEIGDQALLGFWVVEKDGTVINGFYLEKSAEFCMIGTDPVGTAAIIRDQHQYLGRMQQSGFLRYVHCHVPPDVEASIAPHIEDNQFEGTGLIHYGLRLR